MKAPKRVSSGRYIDLDNLRVEDVSIDDINSSLNYLYRFTGHHKNAEPLTVAQHTWLVMELSKVLFSDERAVHFDCLLHDFPEAYYGDIATPLKRLFGEAYKTYTRQVDDTVYSALWVIDEPFTHEVEEKRRVCDLLSLDIERRAMWTSTAGAGLWPEIPNVGFSAKDKLLWFNMAQSMGKVDLVSIYDEFVQ